MRLIRMSRRQSSLPMRSDELVRIVLRHAYSCDQAQRNVRRREHKEDTAMLWGLAVVFLVLWALGFLAFHVTTGMIHLLLLLALVTVVFQFVTGSRASL